MRGLVLAGYMLLASASTSRAECDREWYAGLNVRTELGTHPIRIDGGARFGRLDLTAVLDPLFWTDGEVDVDALASWRLTSSGWGALVGWRPASIGLGNGRQFQHSLLLGFVGPLPNLGAVRVTWGFELELVMVKHGGGLPTDTISFKSTSDLGDDINVSMFIRFDYASHY